MYNTNPNLLYKRKKKKKNINPVINKFTTAKAQFWQDVDIKLPAQTNKTNIQSGPSNMQKVEANEPEADELVDDTSPAPIQRNSGAQVIGSNLREAQIITIQRNKNFKAKFQGQLRPNLTVVGGKAGNIKLFQDKSKNIATTGNESDTNQSSSGNFKPVENNPESTATDSPSKQFSAPSTQYSVPFSLPSTLHSVPSTLTSVPLVQQNVGQKTSLQQKRMTASSFMTPMQNCFFNYPKGIPKSFLQREITAVTDSPINWRPDQINISLNQRGQVITSRPKTVLQMIKEGNLQNQWPHLPLGQPTFPLDQQLLVDQVTALGQTAFVGQPTVPVGLTVGQPTGPGLSTVPVNQVTGQGQPSIPSLMSIDPFLAIPTNTNENEPTQPRLSEMPLNQPQPYSPSDVYEDNDQVRQGSESPDMLQPGEKRLSAFKRLGPLSQPKKPKLTINLLCNKDVREVVEADVPVWSRAEVMESTDDIVMKFRDLWPWKEDIKPKRTVTARHSKSVMILEQEQMDEFYDRENAFIQINVTGYPPTWTKEDVLDAILESVKGKSFIPCFIDFTREECKFLVIRCRQALLGIHRYGFKFNKDNVQLMISISQIPLTLTQIDFIPRLWVRKTMTSQLNDTELDLKEFTMGSDISNFLFYPLNRITNQSELVQMLTGVDWSKLTKLDLSYNRITSIAGFDLPNTIPRLKHLNLGYNCIDKITSFIPMRNMPLHSIVLEGNPLCHDYIQEDHYIQVLKMIFPALVEIDDTLIKPNPKFIRQSYIPEEAAPIVNRFLELYFGLLESADQRGDLLNMYHENAVLTITLSNKLKYSGVYEEYSAVWGAARCVRAGELAALAGPRLARHLRRWPRADHDASSICVDVMHHHDSTTIFRVSGILKFISEELTEDEPLLFFTRTIVLHTEDGAQYEITNEMVYWDLPTSEMKEMAFTVTSIQPKVPSLQLDSPPDRDLKEHLVKIFMKITEISRKPSIKCLETKEWNLRDALEYFASLLRIDDLRPIMN